MAAEDYTRYNNEELVQQRSLVQNLAKPTACVIAKRCSSVLRT